MDLRRGEIWWASLPKPKGSGPGYRRPILIVQAGEFNRSRIGTVLAVVLTTHLRLAAAPGNVTLPRGQSGLPKKSVANVSQIITVDKSFLTQRVRSVSKKLLSELDEGLRLVLNL